MVHLKTFSLLPTCRLILSLGDLTKWKGDAIVNAANERCLGGGGVDGAIHWAAGPDLLAACKKIPEVRKGVRCPTGEARLTPGFQLPAKYVIHTVGPIYDSAEESAPLLASAYRSSLELANGKGLKTVAFPAISCGVYGYPLEEAAGVAIETIKGHCGSLKEVHFVLFGDDTFEAFDEVASRLLDEVSEKDGGPEGAEEGAEGGKKKETCEVQ